MRTPPPFASLVLAALLAGCVTPPVNRVPTTGPASVEAPDPAIGETAAYQFLNGYNGEVLGRYSERIIDRAGDVVRVQRVDENRGTETVEATTRQGGWIAKVRPGFPKVEYSPEFPALPFPLSVGKSWKFQTAARDPETGVQVPVKVQGEVLGWETVQVPAGSFDALKVRRVVYLLDATYARSNTLITEYDWYAPSAGRVIRSENTSGWYDLHYIARGGTVWIKGSWNVVELATLAPGGRAQ